MKQRYMVTLTQAQRQQLKDLISAGTGPARVSKERVGKRLGPAPPQTASTSGSWMAAKKPTWWQWPVAPRQKDRAAGPYGCWLIEWSNWSTWTRYRMRQSAGCS